GLPQSLPVNAAQPDSNLSVSAAQPGSGLPQSLSVGAAPPGFLPPNDEVVAQLNDAQNFRALAKLMQLKQHFTRDSTN
ncbi:unnamed protein product, partial [Brugia pahangi]